MASVRKRLERVCLGLYLVAGAVGMLMEAISQLIAR